MAIKMVITSPGIAIFLDAEYDVTKWWNLVARYAYEAIDSIEMLRAQPKRII
jgi:hypothetical protein